MNREIPIGQLADVLGQELGQTVRAVKIALFNGVIRDTRVDTGRMRGNWQTSVGVEAAGEIERLDPTGVNAMADVSATVTPDGVDYLANNLPYTEKWEQVDGMVARNVARIERNIRERVR